MSDQIVASPKYITLFKLQSLINNDFSYVNNTYVLRTISADRPCIHIHNRLAAPNYNEHGDVQIHTDR